MDDADKNRRDEIVQAALTVFAEQGFHKASIKQIAAAAGLKSPSLIYWYFKDKEELLYAVMTSLTSVFEIDANADAVMDLPPEDVLVLVAQGFSTVITNPNAIRIIKLFLTEALRSAESITPGIQNAERVLNFLISYLGRQIELGRLKPHNPQTSARAFVWMLLGYLMAHDIVPQMGVGLPDIESYKREIIELFLNGLRP
ncbi:MAG: TetR/AcrR family transcriptional regulator [Chloroflexota bacterium]